MKNINLLQIACFLTGHNYNILKDTSEVSKKAVKKYFSALIIVFMLWSIIGFVFTERYLKGNLVACLIASIIMIILIWQIERQIILTISKSKLIAIFRGLIGLVMALIGALIIDQIIFKDDIEKVKINKIIASVNELLPVKTQELSLQIKQLEKDINQKEIERSRAINEVARKPMINYPTTKTESTTDKNTGQITITNQTITMLSVPNPKTQIIPRIDEQIAQLRNEKVKKEYEKLNIQQKLESDFKSKVGLLDELNILLSILTNNTLGFVVYILFLVFFFAIELFVVSIKFGEVENDYDRFIKYQMNKKISTLNKLSLED